MGLPVLFVHMYIVLSYYRLVTFVSSRLLETQNFRQPCYLRYLVSSRISETLNVVTSHYRSWTLRPYPGTLGPSARSDGFLVRQSTLKTSIFKVRSPSGLLLF